MNLDEWFTSNSNVVHSPTQLHVLLTTEGVRQCKSVPYLEEFVVANEDGTGYIHSTIDKGEINFITPLFYRLGKDARVRTGRIDRWFTYTCERNFTYMKTKKR